VIVFDRDGRFLARGGRGHPPRPRLHGHARRHDLADGRGDHTVRKYTRDGRLLLTLGTPGGPLTRLQRTQRTRLPPEDPARGGPFHRPTKVAVAPSGDLYITDGYGNAQVHRFSAPARSSSPGGSPVRGPASSCFAWTVRPPGRARLRMRPGEQSHPDLLADRRVLASLDGPSPSGRDRIPGRPDLRGRVVRRAGRGGYGRADHVRDASQPGDVRDLAGRVLAAGEGRPLRAGELHLGPRALCRPHGDLYVGEIDRLAGPGPALTVAYRNSSGVKSCGSEMQ